MKEQKLEVIGERYGKNPQENQESIGRKCREANKECMEKA